MPTNTCLKFAQLVILNFLLPTRWRQDAFCLNGIVAEDQLLRLPIIYDNPIYDTRTNASGYRLSTSWPTWLLESCAEVFASA